MIEAIVELSVIHIRIDQIEELFTLFMIDPTDTSIHIPEKWNTSLDHMRKTRLSADDHPLTRIDEIIKFPERHER